MQFAQRHFSVVVFALLPVTSYANDASVAVKVSTLGVVIDSTINVSEKINFRVGYSQSVQIFNGTGDLIARGGGATGRIWTYSYDYKQQTIGGLVDVHPFSGSFRASVGLFVNNNKTRVKADASCDSYGIAVPCTYRINGNLYQTSQVSQPQGELSYRLLAPYVGVGWGNALSRTKKWTFACDVGLLYQGKPTVTLDAAGNVAGLQNDLAAERDWLRSDSPAWWPVVSFGIGYNW